MPPSNSVRAPDPKSNQSHNKSSAVKEGKVNQQNAAASKENKTYGTHQTMPVLQADRYAEIELPDLPEWDPMDEENGGVKIDATIVLCGKRRTGKSWALRNLMFLMKDLPDLE